MTDTRTAEVMRDKPKGSSRKGVAQVEEDPDDGSLMVPQVEKDVGGGLRGVAPGECRTGVPPQEDVGPNPEGDDAATLPMDPKPGDLDQNLVGDVTRTAGKPRGDKVTEIQQFGSTDARTRGMVPRKPAAKEVGDRLPKGGRLPGTRRITTESVKSQRLKLRNWLTPGSRAPPRAVQESSRRGLVPPNPCPRDRSQLNTTGNQIEEQGAAVEEVKEGASVDRKEESDSDLPNGKSEP